MLAIVALLTIIVPTWLHYRDAATRARASAGLPTQSTTTVPLSSKPTTTTTTAPANPAPTHKFAFAATGGSCWLEVHAQSSHGKLLYEGLLADGKTMTFAGARLWIRVGAGEHLEVTLNGKPLAGVPRGTADILVTPTGARIATA